MKPADELLKYWIENAGHYTQAGVAQYLGVSRAAVNKWCHGYMAPSREHAKELERLSGGAVPAHRWRRRETREPFSRGAKELRRIAQERGLTVFALANEVGIKPRALFRWATDEHRPRQSGVKLLNEAFGLKLTRGDFEVRA